MIIGNGDIAKVLPERNDLLFFASGVSNSQETRDSEYHREINLLMEQAKNQHVVYFSSLSIFYAYERYQQHKLIMEAIIKKYFAKYTIIRIGNIDWGDNPHTLINFMRNKIAHGESFYADPVFRYIIDKEEFLHWINLIPSWSCEMNIPGRRMLVAQIVSEYGDVV